MTKTQGLKARQGMNAKGSIYCFLIIT